MRLLVTPQGYLAAPHSYAAGPSRSECPSLGQRAIHQVVGAIARRVEFVTTAYKPGLCIERRRTDAGVAPHELSALVGGMADQRAKHQLSQTATPKVRMGRHSADPPVAGSVEQVSRFNIFNNPKVYIGLGYDYKKYVDVIPWFNDAIDKSFKYKGAEVNVVINYNPELGPFSTLQKVLSSIEPQETVIVHPVDVPLLNKQNLSAIINENNIVVIPICDIHKGHPVKLKSEFWTTLLAIDLTSDKARLDTQIKEYDTSSISYLKVNDNLVYQNINTKKDWKIYYNNTTKS